MRQLPLPLRWHDIDWTDDGPPGTVSRPTEDAAIRNIQRQQRAHTGRRWLEPLEHKVYNAELRCIRECPHFMTPHQRAAWITQQPGIAIYNMTPRQIMDILDTVSRVMETADDEIIERHDAPGVFHRIIQLP